MNAIGAMVLGALSSLGIACSALPDSAAPKGGVVAASELDDSDVIPYRALTRADFRGTSVPEPFAAVADRVGAATCGQVRTTPDTQIFVQGVTPAGGETHYFAKVKRLRFQALMDRSCSWWNDKVASFAPAYVLEHEQIHFALYELGARKLNERSEAIATDVENEGSSAEAVQAHAEAAINGALEDAVAEILDQNRDFDEDTSLGYQPARQKEWLSRVTADLADTQRWAHRDGAPPKLAWVEGTVRRPADRAGHRPVNFSGLERSGPGKFTIYPAGLRRSVTLLATAHRDGGVTLPAGAWHARPCPHATLAATRR